jgi:methionyl-tRNA synthetase
VPTENPPVVIVAATPTPNGDLHVGHLAGPYLAADVYARYLTATGRRSVYVTCTDDSQSYVLTTACRQGTRPGDLAATATGQIERSLRAMGISIPALPPIDEQYRRTVVDFVSRLYAAGRFTLRTVRLPYALHTGRYLYDGLVAGACPHCGEGSSGGACEACGQPNSFGELLDARSALDPDEPVVQREVPILVLPAERYRSRLVAYYREREDLWRPNARRLITRLLAGPLPDIPVTVPGEWGIPAPFAETPGQILYPWIEAMPASIYATWWALNRTQPQTGPVDRWWRADSGTRLVYFHGFDNVFHWGFVDLVMLLAHGERYTVPTANVCNEFYELDGAKFSTSRGHLIRVGELLERAPRDIVRFHLALTAPERARTNFTEADLARTAAVLESRWTALADAVAGLVGPRTAAEPVTGDGRKRATTLAEGFRDCYELADYSPARAARLVLESLDRLVASADEVRAGREPLGDLLVETQALLAGAAPLLIDVAAAVREQGVDLSLTDPAETGAAVGAAAMAEVRPLRVPGLAPMSTATAAP